MKSRASALIAAVLFSVLVISGCSRSGDQYLGRWKGPNVEITITRPSSEFVLDCKNPGGMVNGTYTGKYEDGALKLSMAMFGSVTYLKDEDAILLAGEKLRRVK